MPLNETKMAKVRYNSRQSYRCHMGLQFYPPPDTGDVPTINPAKTVPVLDLSIAEVYKMCSRHKHFGVNTSTKDIMKRLEHRRPKTTDKKPGTLHTTLPSHLCHKEKYFVIKRNI